MKDDDKRGARPIESCRVRTYSVSPSIFMYLMKDGAVTKVVENGIPKDATFRGFCHDPLTNNIQVFVEHSSFDLVPEYQVASRGPDIIFKQIKEGE